ncbi:hypothetical protein SDC9_197975 [bioreactor metagenome]|uniref:Uncharacterized protein n=1 Tax=bioreactor metagenome TaxID=1076179 RepID=A0A645IIP1_9ZZZZ
MMQLQPIIKYEEMLNQQLLEIQKDYEIKLKKIMEKYYHIKIICTIINDAGIDGKSTDFVYESYKTLCKKYGILPMHKIAFSRFIVKWFDYKIVNKKVKGKKYRLFINLFNGSS